MDGCRPAASAPFRRSRHTAWHRPEFSGLPAWLPALHRAWGPGLRSTGGLQPTAASAFRSVAAGRGISAARCWHFSGSPGARSARFQRRIVLFAAARRFRGVCSRPGQPAGWRRLTRLSRPRCGLRHHCAGCADHLAGLEAGAAFPGIPVRAAGLRWRACSCTPGHHFYRSRQTYGSGTPAPVCSWNQMAWRFTSSRGKFKVRGDQLRLFRMLSRSSK